MIQYLYQPVDNCISLVVNIHLSNVEGNPLGEWGLYVRTMSGEWRYLSAFYVDSYDYSRKISFDPAISFDAWALNCQSEDGWSFYYDMWLDNAYVLP